MTQFTCSLPTPTPGNPTHNSPHTGTTLYIDNYTPPATEVSVSPKPEISEDHLCALENCRRKGTRLVTSLRYEYRQKPNGSNRVCEGHYRKDLRRYKKEFGDKALLVNHRRDKKEKSTKNKLSKASKSAAPSIPTPVAGTSSSQRIFVASDAQTFSTEPASRKRKRSTSPQQIVNDQEIMTDERMRDIEKYAFRILVQMKKDDPLELAGAMYNSQSDDDSEITKKAPVVTPAPKLPAMVIIPQAFNPTCQPAAAHPVLYHQQAQYAYAPQRTYHYASTGQVHEPAMKKRRVGTAF